MTKKKKPAPQQTPADYLRLVADRLGLRDYEILLQDRPAEQGNSAEMRVVEGQRVILVWLCEEFAGFSADRRRKDSVHEMIHAVLAPIEGPLDDAEDLLGAVLYTLIHKGQARHIEVATDWLAVAISDAGVVPLPQDW